MQELSFRITADPAVVKATLASVRADIASTTKEAVKGSRGRSDADKQLAADIKRYERERTQIVTQNTRAIESLAKTEATTRIREGRRAANALVSFLREESTAVKRLQTEISQTRGGSSFLAGAAGGLAALIGVSAVSEIRAAGAAMLDYSSKLETTTIAFTTMLGSAEAAKQHLQELQQFALKTPFQFGELIDASQRMQALGFNAQQVIPILTDVGNAVAAAGGGSERLDRVVLALSQIQSKGKVATQELNQLAESGISGWKILEEQLGKSRGELVKMVEAGEISSQVFLEAFQKFSKQNFGGLMEAQSKTFAGAMSNIKDALLQTSAVAFAPLYARLTETALRLSELSTKSEDFKKQMVSVGNALATMWDGAIEAIYIVRDAYRLVMAALTGQVFALVEAFSALVHAAMAAYHALAAVAALMRGDFVEGAKQAWATQRALEGSTDALRRAVIAQGSAVRQLGIIWTEAGNRAAVAAAKMAAAKAAATSEVGDKLGADAAAPGFMTSKSTGVPSISGGGKGSGARGPSAEEREFEQRQERITNYTLALTDAINKLDAEIDGVSTSTKEWAVEQDILNGALKDATPEVQEKARQDAKDIDNKTTQIRLTKELTAYNEALAEQVRLAIEGQKSNLRITQELIESLQKQGKEIHPVTLAWMQISAGFVDAKTTAEELKPALDALAQTLHDMGPLFDPLKKVLSDSQVDALGSPEPGTPGINNATSAIDQLRDHLTEALGDEATSPALAGLEALTTAFEGLGQAVGQVVQAWVLYGSAGTSVKKVTAQILASVAQQAAVKAVFELAEGFAALAMAFFGIPNAGPSASAHFTAAAIYGGIAVGAAVAGRAVAGNAFTSAAGGGGSTGGGGGASARPSAPEALDVGRRKEFGPQKVEVELKFAEGFDQVVEARVVNNWRNNGQIRRTVQEDR